LRIHEDFEDHGPLEAPLAGAQRIFRERIPAVERCGFMHRGRL